MLSNDCWKATLRSLQSGWFYMHLWKDFGFICTSGKILVLYAPLERFAISLWHTFPLKVLRYPPTLFGEHTSSIYVEILIFFDDTYYVQFLISACADPIMNRPEIQVFQVWRSLIWCKDRKDISGFIIKAECPCKGMWHLFNLPGTRRTRWCTRGVLIARDNVMVACRHPTFAPPDATAMQFYLSFILVIEMSYFMLLPFTC